MGEVEPRIEERVGRSPDARALVSIWTEKGWKRIMEMYFVSPSRQEINALHDLAEAPDEASVDLNETVEDGSNEVALLSYPKPRVRSSSWRSHGLFPHLSASCLLGHAAGKVLFCLIKGSSP